MLDDRAEDITGMKSETSRMTTQEFITFINSTNRNVEIRWVNFQGKCVFYKYLEPEAFVDINTFASHLWIFTDRETKERLLGNSEMVFRPEPWFERYKKELQNKEPLCRIALQHRTIKRLKVYITNPMRTLRTLCLVKLRTMYNEDERIDSLHLPLTLKNDLKYHVTLLKQTCDDIELND